MLVGENCERVGKQIAIKVRQRRRISPDARRLTINGGGDGIIIARETHQLRVFVCLFRYWRCSGVPDRNLLGHAVIEKRSLSVFSPITL